MWYIYPSSEEKPPKCTESWPAINAEMLYCTFGCKLLVDERFDANAKISFHVPLKFLGRLKPHQSSHVCHNSYISFHCFCSLLYFNAHIEVYKADNHHKENGISTESENQTPFLTSALRLAAHRLQHGNFLNITNLRTNFWRWKLASSAPISFTGLGVLSEKLQLRVVLGHLSRLNLVALGQLKVLLVISMTSVEQSNNSSSQFLSHRSSLFVSIR